MATAVLRVAVVDDEAPVRTALARLLRLADYDVDMFASGEEFLAAIDALCPDCAVLDIHMPGLTGLDVQSRLKAAHRNIPVVFITASDDFELGTRALNTGARLLRKPFSNDELLAAIGAVLCGNPSAAS